VFYFVASVALGLPSRASLYCTLSDAATLWEERRSPGYCCLLFYFRPPSIHFIILPLRTRRWLRFAGAEGGSRFLRAMGSRVRRPAPSILGSLSNVVDNQAGYLARPTTKAPETQIYFTTHGSGAFPVPRVRTVVRGERASRSIVNRTTALWSIWGVASLILAGSG